MKKLRRLFSVMGIVLLLLMVGTSPVLAVANPDSIAIQSVKVFQNIFEDDDMLFFVRYDVNYGSDPSEPASDTFLIVLLGTDGTTLLYQRPLNYYDLNIISIYLTATQAGGLVWGDPYVMKVMGNPVYFGTPVEDTNMDTITLEESSNYISGGMTTSRSSLGTFCISTARLLESDVDWPDLLTSSDLLNEAGAITFSAAIPGLYTVVPGIYATAVGPPTGVTASRTVTLIGTVEDGPFDASEAVVGATTEATGTYIDVNGSATGIQVEHSTSIMYREGEVVNGGTSGASLTVTEVIVGKIEAISRDRTGARLRGVVDNLGDWLGVSGNMIGGLSLFIVFALAGGFVFNATGSVHGAILCAYPVILLGNFIGLLSFAFTWMLVIVVALIFAVLFIMGRLA